MYPTRYVDPMAVGRLEERMVRCGKPTCHCANGELHGPYWYLTYKVWDGQLRRWRQRRRYVKPECVAYVQRVIGATKALDRAAMRLLDRRASVRQSQPGKEKT